MIDETIYRGGAAGARKLKKDLGILGLRAQRDVQATIRAGGVPFIENAPSTLAKKYPATGPLRHTNRMRQSISFKVEMGGGR
jgi:hypothetical protein